MPVVVTTNSVSGVASITSDITNNIDFLTPSGARIPSIVLSNATLSTSLTLSNTVLSSTNLGIGTLTPASSLDLSRTTSAIALPQGTTAQRPSGNNPYIRWNTTNSALEIYNGTNWIEIITDYFPTGSVILG